MISTCPACAEPFDYWDEGTKGWLPRQPEDIICPNCGAVCGAVRTLGYVRSRTLSEAEKAEYVRRTTASSTPTDKP